MANGSAARIPLTSIPETASLNHEILLSTWPLPPVPPVDHWSIV
jgi:hypothetical protein